MDEKRKFPRIGVSFPVECKNLKSQDFFYTVSKDLSLGGVKILSDSFLAKDNSMKIDINLIDRILSLKAKVAWCSAESRSERYAAGLTFTDITDSAKRGLFRFLNKVAIS